MAKRESTKSKRRPKTDEYSPIYLTQYEITDEPIEERAYRRLPKSVKVRLERLYQEAQRNPKPAIKELLELKEKYPQVPQIYNYLAVGYSRARELEKAEGITEENIRKNPTYLFAKINLAEFCLQRDEYDKIPEIFDDKYDLQMLYPNRKKFHISEFVNFMGIMGLYFVGVDQREIAERYNEMLQEVASDYPMAKRLNQALNPGILTRAFKYLLSKQTGEK